MAVCAFPLLEVLTDAAESRKYRKNMVKFEKSMTRNMEMFKEEQKVLDLTRRLAEQNEFVVADPGLEETILMILLSQLLSLLADLNSNLQIPSVLRFDLSTALVSRRTIPPAEKIQVRTEALELLANARTRLRNGEMKLGEFQDMETELAQKPFFHAEGSYASLAEEWAITNITTESTSHNRDPETNAAFLNVKDEDEYLNGLDAFLDGKVSQPRPHAPISTSGTGQTRAIEHERELQLQNPVSVYNWLRKNQPSVFLQDHEGPVEKTSRSAGTRSSKRGLLGERSTTKQDSDMYDTDGIAVDLSASSRNKRKRDDDLGYRPKGGSSRPAKRRKGEGSYSRRRGQKSSISLS